MQNEINIEPEHLVIVRQILHDYLPTNIKVWVFGSRATNNAKKFSDLDLALQQDDQQVISGRIIINLSQAFEDSLLPWKVDLVDYNNLSTNFKDIIDNNKKLLRY